MTRERKRESEKERGGRARGRESSVAFLLFPRSCVQNFNYHTVKVYLNVSVFVGIVSRNQKTFYI